MTRYLIYFTPSQRAPSFKFWGRSGKSYAVKWNDAHKLMCLGGTSLSGAEYDALEADIFNAGRDLNLCDPACRRIIGTGEETERGPSIPTLGATPNYGQITQLCQRIGEQEAEIERLKAGRQPETSPATVTSGPSAPPTPTKANPLPKGFEGTYDPDDL